MREKYKVKNKRSRIYRVVKNVILIILLTIILSTAFVLCSVSKYFPVDAELLEELTDASLEKYEAETGIKVEISTKQIALIPDNADTCIIMYPGAKVSNEAYLPLFKMLAEDGYMCVLRRINAADAFFKIHSADDVVESNPNIDHFYLAGHSLGGTTAAIELSKHENVYEGLILLASYASVDLNGTDDALSVLSIYGSNDGVLSRERYVENKANLPFIEEHIIDGGNHAGFAAYGPQKGDGIATITKEEQMRLTAEYIKEYISKNQ